MKQCYYQESISLKARLTYVEVPLPSSAKQIFNYAVIGECYSDTPSRITNDFGVASRMILQLMDISAGFLTGK